MKRCEARLKNRIFRSARQQDPDGFHWLALRTRQ
jgi:hypothetical protein